ncbi:MAG TPA: TonB-dependent receptor [Acidobacteriaceae bacterium]|jgi:catecholate siderophore receptor|nr:TonB-dependent receptor [Acidobacteriaceae bacterium]
MIQKLLQRKTRRGWEVCAGWRLRTLMTTLMAVSGAMMPTGLKAQKSTHAAPVEVAKAGDAEPAGPQAPTARHTFAIPAGSLAAALDGWQQTTGIRLDITIPADKLATLQSPGVDGVMPNTSALKELLKGTGLTSAVEAGGEVSVGIRSVEQVEVTSSVASIAMQQFPEPVLDTAQTVDTVPQFVMQDQAATTLRDGLRNVPGISMAAGEGGSQGDNLTIRGFSARNDIFLDGIRDFGSYYRDAFDYQSIDVLEGPAGVEFGRGSTGGVVNQETKQPELNELIRGTAQFGTDEMRRVAVDINEPLTNFGTGAAFRVDAVGTQSMVAERDIAETRRFGIAPALEFGLNTPTRFEVQYLHESENSTPDYGLPYFGPAVAGVDRTSYYGFASDNYLRTNPDVMTGKLEHDFNPHLTIGNLLRWANYPRDVRITEPQINTVATVPNPTVAGAPVMATCAPASTAATSCYALDTPLGQVMVKRNQLTSRSTEDMLWDQVTADAHVEVLHVANDLVFLIEGGRERSDPDRNGYTMPYVPAIDPNPYDPFQPTSSYPGVRTYVASQSCGFGFNDTMPLRNWLLLAGGVRFDYFNTDSHSAANPLASPATAAFDVSRLDKQPTYRAAVVLKPRPEGSFYFDWGTSFDPSAESLSLSGNNATAAPEENETWEAGGKWDFLRDRLDLSGSVFRTRKDNAHETDPNNSANTLTVGTYMVRGLQTGALGHLPGSFDLVLGYAILDGYLENSALNASPFNAVNLALIALHDRRANTAPFFISPNGFPIANVPKNSGNLWLTHRLIGRFSGGFGVNYTGARRASSGALIGIYNTSAPIDVTQVPLAAKAVPGYWISSAMVRRPLSERIDFQINVNNLTNKFYIDEPHPNHLVPGEGVNAQFGLNYKF